MTTGIIKILIPTDKIRAALCAVSDEKARPYLCGVFIDARGYIAATNGAIAFAARLPEAVGKLDDCKPSYVSASFGLPGIIIPTAALAAVAKSKARIIGLERDASGLWWLDNGSGTRQHFVPVDAAFPDWQRVIPQAPEKQTTAHYDPKLIAAIGAMASALRGGKKGNAHLHHIHQAGETPALVTFPEDNRTGGPRGDCCAVIMPMRAMNYGGFSTDAFLGRF